ncbi:MAG TPA: ribokinase [Dehalococcoidia bacterium]|nr:ribokinase [Dehalococcoidia bacterium]
MARVAVLASFNMDLVMRAARRPDGGETLQGDFSMHLGGKGFNQAVAAHRLGAEVGVTGRVGDDDFGRMFLAALDREDIDRRAVVVDRSAGTGVAAIVVEPDGTNTIIQAPRANRGARPSDWMAGYDSYAYEEAEAPPFFEGVDVALANLETNADAAARFLRQMRIGGKRWGAMLNAAPAADVPPDLRAQAQVIIVNEIEARRVTGIDASEGIASAVEAARQLHGVVTLGEHGAVAVAHGTRVHVPAFDVSVVDTTGAGDAFCAAFAIAVQDRHLADALRFANAAGAVACTRHGAYESMPRLAEVEELLASGRERVN